VLETVSSLRPAFADGRVFERFRRLVFGMLTAEDRRTITALLEATGRTQCDWSADYRVFSQAAWDPHKVFALLLPRIIDLYPPSQRTIVAALDDTNIRKTGTHIPGVAYRRDPMSPPFQANLIRAQRFVQTSVAVPFAATGAAARAIPVAFDHAPSAGKLPKTASEEEKQRHRERERALKLSTRAIASIQQLRNELDQASATDRSLLITIDGSYTNRAVLRNLPANTRMIGRIRKDAVLHDLPVPNEGRGRPRVYGTAITPEEFRQDESIGWTSLKIFAAGREHDCDVKQRAPMLWRASGRDILLRLIVIRPLAYRKSKKSRLLYRQPAYLITTDLDSPLAELVQAYFWRWDIEVNHRDEKQLIGVGHAQVRSPRSAERVPTFAVACYSILLISAAKAFGIAASDPVTLLPKWLAGSHRKPVRLPTRQLIRRLRIEHLSAPTALPNFDHFDLNVARHMKLPKNALSLSQALHHALN
jgi:hypothetical protein